MIKTVIQSFGGIVVRLKIGLTDKDELGGSGFIIMILISIHNDSDTAYLLSCLIFSFLYGRKGKINCNNKNSYQ